MSALSDFQVGQTVELQDGQIATVQFVGQTNFASGDWVGVVLESATGKNDGSVKGERYFDCQAGHGMFVRPTVPKILDHPTPKASGRADSKVNGNLAGKRQSTTTGGTRRQSVIDPAAAKRQSISTGSPTPASRGSQAGRLLRSPSKSPTKQPAYLSSGNSTPRSTSSTNAAKPPLMRPRAARPSMGPPSSNTSSTRPARQSIAGTINGLALPPSITSASSQASSRRQSIRPEDNPRLSSISGESQVSAGSGYESPAQSLDNEALSPPVEDIPEEPGSNGINPSQSQESLISQDSLKTSSSRARSPPERPHKPPITNSATSRENEDLKTKLRVMEKRRMEDREKLKSLERIQSERDKFEGIIQRLQTKYQPQHQEVAELRKQLKDTEAKIEALERQEAENETVVEVAALDREMAEETAETLKSELDAMKTSHEELRLEVEVLREENQELGKEMSPEEKTSQGWLQMERSNERLRDALMRLRDVTQEQEAGLLKQITELESDLQGLRGAREQQVQTSTALTESESTIEELRQQLETALGAEDMIEELTQKNLALNEQVEDLKAAVEELESLKELNDELEINHTENAKQMQQEIDSNEILLATKDRDAAAQDQTIQDMEYTLTKFRNLVTSMQSDLEDMRQSQQLTESEANDLTSRSRAMMDLNLRLQTSATKAQVKAIDLELGKLEAEESAEHLSIIQLFLPDSFKVERNSVRAYLRFKRIKFKSDLAYGYIRDRLATPSIPNAVDDVFTACDAMDSMVYVSSTCERFIKSIQSCDLDAFIKLESALFDLEPVERAFNGWIDAMKKDELKEEACATELSRTKAVMTHLAEVHIRDGIEHHADDLHARALVMQGQLESTLVGITQMKAMAEAKVVPPSAEDNEGDSDVEDFTRKIDSVVSQGRSAKVVLSKTIRQLDDLQSRSLTLNPSALPSIEQAQTAISELSDTARSHGRSVTALLNEEKQSGLVTARDISTTVSSAEPSLSSLVTKVQSTSSSLQSLYNISVNLTHATEFPAPSQDRPWHLRAQRLSSESTASAQRDIDMARLTEDASANATTLALRDKAIEELSVKLETLDKRASESGGRRERVRELEAIMEKAKEREMELVGTVNRLRAERNELRAQRESWGSKPEGTGTPADAAQETTSEASLARIAALETEIKHLEAAIRHLRSTSFKHATALGNNDFLNKPLIPKATAKEQKMALRRSEAKGVVSELLRLATEEGNGLVGIRPRDDGKNRLGWRSVKETCWWRVERQREEWEEWREWRDGFGRLGSSVNRYGERRGRRIGAADLPTVGKDGGGDGAGEARIVGVDEE